MDPEHAGCVTVDVTGLQPGTTYHYWFEADGVLSPVGRTRPTAGRSRSIPLKSGRFPVRSTP